MSISDKPIGDKEILHRVCRPKKLDPARLDSLELPSFLLHREAALTKRGVAPSLHLFRRAGTAV